MFLNIENLHAQVEDKSILKGINLQINPGEVHAIMGPNGSGKSTLSSVLAGREDYEVTEGSVSYQGQDLLDMDADERAQQGVFLAFQYPVEIPGVSNKLFMHTALNAKRAAAGEAPLDMYDFEQLALTKMKMLEMSPVMLERSVNVGFSGGEKKRNDIFQMAMLEPKLCIMDETDSGLDIDALRIVASGVNALRSPERSFIVVTHYQRLLDHIKPDFVHVLYDGKIIKSGGFELAHELEEKGYDHLIQAYEKI
jgi:Fe-S cluster assembly ATP-binding protein